MLRAYLPIAVLLVISTGLAFIVVGLGHLFGPEVTLSEPPDSTEAVSVEPSGAAESNRNVARYA